MYPYIRIDFLHRLIPTYGLMMALGMLLCGFWGGYRCKKRGLDVNNFIIIATFCVMGALVGAKLLYLLVTFSPAQLWAMIRAGDFSVFVGGGLVFYGGLILAIGFAFIGAWVAQDNLLLYENAVVPCIPFGHALGRIGCLLGGCCYGMPYDGPLAVQYPGEDFTRFPVQPLEALLNCCVGCVLLLFARKARKPMAICALYLMLYSVERFFLEMLRGDEARGIFEGLSSSQWISLGLALMGGILLVVRIRPPKKAE